MKQLEGIDVTKCVHCRKGILPFISGNGRYYHLDFFATYEAGQIYSCGNEATVGQYLTENDRGTCDETEELKEVMEWQEFWWDDIMTILEKMFNRVWADAADYINNNKLLLMSNKEMEDFVIKDATERGIVIDREECQDLISNKEET